MLGAAGIVIFLLTVSEAFRESFAEVEPATSPSVPTSQAKVGEPSAGGVAQVQRMMADRPGRDVVSVTEQDSETRTLAGRVVTEDGSPFVDGKVYVYSMWAKQGDSPSTKATARHQDCVVDASGRFHFTLPVVDYPDNSAWVLVVDNRDQWLLKCRLEIRSGHLVRVVSSNHPDWYLKGRLRFSEANPRQGGLVLVQSDDGSILWGGGRFDRGGKFCLRGDFVPWPKIRGPVHVIVRTGAGLGQEAADLPFQEIGSLIESVRKGLTVRLMESILLAPPAEGRIGIMRRDSRAAMKHTLALTDHRACCWLQVGDYRFSVQGQDGVMQVGVFTVRLGQPVVKLKVMAQFPGRASLTIEAVDEAGQVLRQAKVSVSLIDSGVRLASFFAPMKKSDDTGAIRIPDLTPGQYQVVVYAPGMRKREINVKVRGAYRMRVEMRGDRALYLDPVGNASFVEFERTVLCLRSSSTDKWTVLQMGSGRPDGDFVRGLEVGTYDLHVRAGVWLGATRVRIESSTSVLRVPIAMRRVTPIDGVIFGPPGSTLPVGLSVRIGLLGRPHLPWESAAVKEDGSFRLLTDAKDLKVVHILDRKGNVLRTVKVEACGAIRLK